MSWNYRVMIRDGEYAIHEVFYDGDGHIKGYTEDPVFPRAETLEDLVAELGRYGRALQEPILDYRQLESEAEQRREATPPSVSRP